MSEGGEKVVLCCSYRSECWSWIKRRHLFVVPIPEGESPHKEITHCHLTSEGGQTLTVKASFSHEIGDRSWLKEHKCEFLLDPSVTRYAIYHLDRKSSVDVVSLKHARQIALSASGVVIPFPPQINTSFTFIDLFAGIGGFRQAMQSCGGRCVFSSEFDAAAQKTYEANYGEKPKGDITKAETKDLIPDSFDVVCAGFPCQAFSLAGKRMGFNDNFKGLCRGTLFKEVVEICEKHHPAAAFCENVKGLLIHDKKRTLQVIKGAFEEIGYRFCYHVLNSKDFRRCAVGPRRVLSRGVCRQLRM